MRILQINPIAGHSSTGRAVSELDRYFNEHGHESYVACSSGYDVKNMYVIGSKTDRLRHALLTRVTGYEASFSNRATKDLIKFIEKIKPDVVKIGIIHSNYLNFFLLIEYLSMSDIPTVLVLDDCWYYTGKCMHYTKNACFRWKDSCGHCPHLENGLKTWFFDRTEKLLKEKKKHIEMIPRLAVVGVSDWITNEARDSILKNAQSISRIYNWIDMKVFYPRENTEVVVNKYQLHKNFTILGVASKWVDGKGLKQFCRLSEEKEKNISVVIVGTVSSNVQLPDSLVHIPETRDMDELAQIYSYADVFVTFSEEETFGKVSAEALACGTPVICYDSTASPEIVGHDQCGKVVTTGDFEAVVYAIEEVREKGKDFYTDACVRRAREMFSLEKSAQEYLNVFSRLINC